MSERRSVLITGAASGFGYETVKNLTTSPEYGPIYATDINPIIQELFQDTDFSHVVPLEFDIRDVAQIASVVDRIVSDTGGVDVLVNNAGVLNSGTLESYLEDGKPTPELRELWETNLYGPILLMDAVLEHMRRQRSGVVINITSSTEHNRSPLRRPYADYKAVFAGVTRQTAEREAPYNIRVVNVQPGMHRTAIERNIWTNGTNDLEAISAQQLYDWWRRNLGAHPRKVAEAVLRIADGEIQDHRVLVGLDTHFTTFMHEHVPGWNRAFDLGFNAVVLPIKFGISISRRNGHEE